MSSLATKRLLFLTPRLTSGGAERQMVNLAISLKERGYTVDFLCYSYGDFFEKELKEKQIPVFWRQHKHVIRLISCAWFLQKRHYDVVISFLPTPSFINCFSAMICKRWKVITGERSSVVVRPASLLGKFDVWLRRYSDNIVCNSDNARQLWSEVFPKYREKLKTIYNMVSINANDYKYEPLRDGKLHICIAATIYDVKNPMGVINALLLMDEIQRNKIVIDWYGSNQAQIGDTRVFDEVCQAIQKYNLQDSFHIHDATKDINKKMTESDCVALFSKYEGLPNAICEAIVIGKPIIMTRVSDYAKLVKDGENGFLCNWDSPETIKESIVKMSLLSVNELLEMGNQSKKIGNLLFSEEKIIVDWINVIEGGEGNFC